MKVVLLTSFVIALLCIVSLGSIPSRNNLRYNEVTGLHLASNSVENEDIQDFAVDRQALMNRVVSNAKMGPLAINSEQIAPGAITTSGASLDLVKLFIRDENTIPSEGQNENVQMRPAPESIQPTEAIDDPTLVMVDNPDRNLAYKVEGKARGSGVILGWYPSQNGHLLRYQASRALRGIVCSVIDIASIDIACSCTADGGCSCGVSGSEAAGTLDVNFASELDCTSCTVLDCGDASSSNAPDIQCLTNPPIDDDGDEIPDNCGSFTSVSDVNNPQEGVPVYAPSVESITIDETGRVEMSFFGRGTIVGPHPDIEITVVVLLDDQYGA
mmetsp:Transcript_10371/g.17673  ORF Transcript_10371/g.17673 Transcript_10371/m.17673 type:complete len:328 (-) Transcript_10371:80-1063(-)